MGQIAGLLSPGCQRGVNRGFSAPDFKTRSDLCPPGLTPNFRFNAALRVHISVTIVYFISYDLLPNEVNCCFLSILLHKYLILCFFTSYSREIIIQKKFWSHPAAKWIGSWLFLLLLSILMAACLRQIDMSHAKEWVLRRTQFGNVYILGVNNASTSFFTIFHPINSYLPHILLKITSFLLPIWSTFVYEASLLSLRK